MKKRLLVRLALGLVLSSTVAACAASSATSPTGEKPGGQDGAPDAGGDMETPDGKPDGGSTRVDATTPAPIDNTDAGRVGSDAGDKTRDADVASDAAVTSDASTGDAGRQYIDLKVPLGTPLDRSQGDKHPMDGFAAPAGWSWYNIEGAKCRDGSQNGIFVHYAEPRSSKLMIYFEGGGACANPGFCTLNPINVNQQFLTGGESALASLVILNVPQAPNGAGIFDLANTANPFAGWNMVYIPYCTGDVHFGANPEGTIEGVAAKQAFVGAQNTKLMIARIAATFTELDRFVAAGSSAGGFGAGLNFGMIQDTFGPQVFGSVLLDASPPFSNPYIPVCLQKRWRESWNLDANIPSDCGAQCKSVDGGNLFQIVDYWRAKYPKTNVALISGIHDEIIRLFFSLGNNDCASYGADPPSLFIGTVGQTYDPAKFKDGLTDLRTRYVDSKQLASFYMDGFPNSTAHQALFRPRLYEEAAGAGKGTMAAFLKKWVAGELTQVGP